jgi:hypothetical protein
MSISVIPYGTQWAVQLPIGKVIVATEDEARRLADRIAAQENNK